MSRGASAIPGAAQSSSRHDKKFNTEAAKLGRLSLSFFSATCTNRSGSVNGNGTITAYTTLKMVVFAAMASATVTTTAAVKAGVHLIMRIAYRTSFSSTARHCYEVAGVAIVAGRACLRYARGLTPNSARKA
jgi:hypothetical protein